MKIIDNTVIASPGKYLMYLSELVDSITLGKKFVNINGNTLLVTVKLEDIKEVYSVAIQDKNYYISATNYNDAVAELIRLKYSLDDELALIANYRAKGETQEEKDFQNWRKVCKSTAKALFNE